MTSMVREVYAGPFRLRDMGYDANEVHPRHAHDETQISILLRGAMREDVRGVAYAGCAGDVIVKPAGVLHGDAFEGARILCLDADPRAIELPLREYAWHRTPGVTAAALRVARRFFAGEALEDEVDELLAAFPAPVSVDRALATRAAHILDETRMSVRELAAQLGVHRVHLARVFREQWRCTPREYALRLRVRAAAHRLATGSAPLAEIALDTGFSDQAHMTRAFARRTGVTPAAFRRLARA